MMMRTSSLITTARTLAAGQESTLAHMIKVLEIQPLLSQYDFMNTVLDIGRLSHTDKLRAMEELWDDLSRSQDEYPSPAWHGDVLRDREKALKSGQDEFVPWEEAKAILRRAK